jgi:hypothetical protein
MHLSRLTPAEMLPLSHGYLDPADPAHQALASVPELASLMPRLREAHQVLLASQSADELRAGSLQRVVTALDAEHDDLVRGIDSIFQGLALLAQNEEERSAWDRLHTLLLPNGQKIAEFSYELEGNNAVLLRHIVDGLSTVDQQRLKNQRVGNRTLRDAIERWIEVGTALGQKEQERLSLPIAPAAAELKSAQTQWVRIVGAMVAMLQMSSLLGELPDGVKQYVLLPLQAATERKTPRLAAQGASSAQTPTARFEAAPQP